MLKNFVKHDIFRCSKDSVSISVAHRLLSLSSRGLFFEQGWHPKLWILPKTLVIQQFKNSKVFGYLGVRGVLERKLPFFFTDLAFEAVKGPSMLSGTKMRKHNCQIDHFLSPPWGEVERHWERGFIFVYLWLKRDQCHLNTSAIVSVS